MSLQNESASPVPRWYISRFLSRNARQTKLKHLISTVNIPRFLFKCSKVSFETNIIFEMVFYGALKGFYSWFVFRELPCLHYMISCIQAARTTPRVASRARVIIPTYNSNENLCAFFCTILFYFSNLYERREKFCDIISVCFKARLSCFYVPSVVLLDETSSCVKGTIKSVTI